jgi:hypothetical protein
MQQQFVFPFDLEIADLPDHFPLAVVDSVDLGVLHEFGCEWTDLLQVLIVVDVGYFELLLLDETVDVGPDAIHYVLLNKIIID